MGLGDDGGPWGLGGWAYQPPRREYKQPGGGPRGVLQYSWLATRYPKLPSCSHPHVLCWHVYSVVAGARLGPPAGGPLQTATSSVGGAWQQQAVPSNPVARNPNACMHALGASGPPSSRDAGACTCTLCTGHAGCQAPYGQGRRASKGPPAEKAPRTLGQLKLRPTARIEACPVQVHSRARRARPLCRRDDDVPIRQLS